MVGYGGVDGGVDGGVWWGGGGVRYGIRGRTVVGYLVGTLLVDRNEPPCKMSKAGKSGEPKRKQLTGSTSSYLRFANECQSLHVDNHEYWPVP